VAGVVGVDDALVLGEGLDDAVEVGVDVGVEDGVLLGLGLVVLPPLPPVHTWPFSVNWAGTASVPEYEPLKPRAVLPPLAIEPL
jgi:hypothetical protein